MDRYGTTPMSVFTVEEPERRIPSCRPQVRRSASCTLLMQLVLLLFALLALCGAALQTYYLWRVQANVDATREMLSPRLEPHLDFRSAFPDCSSLPSAHLTGQIDKDKSPMKPLQWETTQGLAFLHEMKYNNGSLRCTKSGLYFVYSKLQLGIACSKQVDPPLFFTHSVNKRSMDIVIPLMENIGGFCNTQGSRSWKKSSFLGSSFLLEEGDEIYVNMTYRDLIRVSGETTTFFGLFML